MHFGNIISINRESIRLSSDLLTPISIHDNSIIYGLFYPASKSLGYNEIIQYIKPMVNDFMFTPIPPSLWPYLGRFNIIAKHKPGAIASIAKFFNDNNIGILTSECTRSGHRYLTWTVTVYFEVLLDTRIDISKDMFMESDTDRVLMKSIALDLFNKVQHEIVETKNRLREVCKDVILDQEKGENSFLDEPVEGFPVKALSYFHNYVLLNANHTLDRPFELKCESNRFTFDDTFRRHLNFHHIMEQLPAYAFAEMSTRDVNLRIVIIPNDAQQDFRKLNIEYERYSTEKKSSTGVFSKFIAPLREETSIWRISQKTLENTNQIEHGYIDLIIHKQTQQLDWSRLLNKVQSINLTENQMAIKKVNLQPVRRTPIFISIKHNKSFTEDAVKKCHEQGEKLGILLSDFIRSDDSNREVTRDLSNKLRQCRGMIQFFIADSENEHLDWLNMEAFAADVLEMPYVRITNEASEKLITVDRDMPFRYQWDGSDANSVVYQALKDLLEIMDKGVKSFFS